jgi:hypothetical protein
VKAAVSRLGFTPSAEEIRVDIEAGRLEFTTRPGTKLDPKGLRQAIEEAGYGVGAITVEGRPVTGEPAAGARGP